MKYINIIGLFLGVLLIFTEGEAQTYSLRSPDKVWELPKELEEISGMTFTPDYGMILAIQDEIGTIFGIDTATGEVIKKWKFLPKDDYEGIAMSDSMVFVLRSDGVIFRSKWQDGPVETPFKMDTAMPKGSDVEGLTYDPQAGVLLMAVKEEKGISNKGFYRIDMETGRREDALIGFSKAQFKAVVQKQLSKAQRARVLKWMGKHDDEFLLGPSGINIHPLTGQIFMCSSRGKVLLLVNREGELENVWGLDGTQFPQPEGLIFNQAGDLFISNEGKKHKKPGTILVFRAGK